MQTLPVDEILGSHRTQLWPLSLIGKRQALCLLLTDDQMPLFLGWGSSLAELRCWLHNRATWIAAGAP